MGCKMPRGVQVWFSCLRTWSLRFWTRCRGPVWTLAAQVQGWRQGWKSVQRAAIGDQTAAVSELRVRTREVGVAGLLRRAGRSVLCVVTRCRRKARGRKQKARGGSVGVIEYRKADRRIDVLGWPWIGLDWIRFEGEKCIGCNVQVAMRRRNDAQACWLRWLRWLLAG